MRLDDDPYALFDAWYGDARTDHPASADITALATVDADGRPAVRNVLFRGMSGGGPRFFTNLGSRKAAHLRDNPAAALLFYWRERDRQVRIEGDVAPLSREEVAAYFQSRPRESRLAAWASRQSEPLNDRTELTARFEAYTAQFAEGPVPLPDFWGGYRLVPRLFEFWTSGAHRLHHRLAFHRTNGGWAAGHLYP